MAKKVRRKVRRSKKQLWLNDLFSFPKVVVYGVVILSVITLYQIFIPGN